MIKSSEPTFATPAEATVPGKCLPNSLWFGVCDVMRSHGIEVPAVEVIKACAQMITATPAAQGGSLLPDGTVEDGDHLAVVNEPLPIILVDGVLDLEEIRRLGHSIDAPIPFTLAEVTR
jgi:hypothetical protein